MTPRLRPVSAPSLRQAPGQTFWLALGLALLAAFFPEPLCRAQGPVPADARPVVLFVESYHDEFPWVVSCLKGLRGVLGPGVDLRTFAMDTKRLPPREHPARAELAWQAVLEARPRVVVLGDDAALTFLGPRLVQAGMPGVYLGINGNPRDSVGVGRCVTGVLERPLFKRNVLLLKDLLPKPPRKVLLLFDTDLTTKVLAADPFDGSETMDIGGIGVDMAQIGELDAWKDAVLSAREKGYQAVILGLYHTLRDENGQSVDSEEVLRWTSAHVPVPLLCFWDFSVGAQGALGGLVLWGETQGRAAGELVRDILAGASPQDLRPVIPEQGRFLFSRAGLARWGLALPEQISSQAEFVD